jgi:hypothetical protein
MSRELSPLPSNCFVLTPIKAITTGSIFPAFVISKALIMAYLKYKSNQRKIRRTFDRHELPNQPYPSTSSRPCEAKYPSRRSSTRHLLSKHHSLYRRHGPRSRSILLIRATLHHSPLSLKIHLHLPPLQPTRTAPHPQHHPR